VPEKVFQIEETGSIGEDKGKGVETAIY